MKALIRTITPFIIIYALFVGCSGEQPPSEYVLPAGNWRVAVTLPGGELPFLMEISDTETGRMAAFVNGEERVPVQDVSISADTVRLTLPTLNSRVEAVSNGSELDGTLTLTKRGGILQIMPFHAVLGETHRFFSEAETPASINVDGRWEVLFVEDDGTETAAVGEFSQDGHVVKGTFLTPTGDYRFLAGQVQDSVLYLSCFDGGHAFLFKAKLASDGRLHGDFWSGTKWHERWSAVRNADAALPDAYELTYIKDGYDGIEFAFPDVDGNIVSLDDERFQGKVVMLTIAGSWCPNCNDEAKFLAPFYKIKREKGLEIIGLMYEHFKDFETSAKQVRRFRKKFGIEYELLVAGYSDKKDAAETLPMLNHVLSYPTTIFIDKKGNVRKIHTGFTGPGTGAHFEKLTYEFNGFVDKLLAE